MRYDQVRCEFLLNNVWVDLNRYRLQAYPIHGSIGIQGTGPLDRVASTGTLKLTLLNTNNQFTPGHANCMPGFETGMKFRLRITYSGRTLTRFYGTVPPDGISIKSTKFVSTTEVLAVDYMETLAVHELDLPPLAFDKKISDIVDLILENIPVKPLSLDLDTGKSTFGSVFDTTSEKARALQEIGKVTLAELGFVYIKSTPDCDEVLVVEERQARNGKALSTTQVPELDSIPDRRITQSSDVRITEDTATRVLQPNFVSEVIEISDDFKDVDFRHAKDYYNRVSAKAYPRRVDANNVVLFTLERTLRIDAGATIELRGRYKDPDQLAVSVAAHSNVDPVAATDYLFNSAEDGSGVNMTASLTVEAVPGANGIDYKLTNTDVTTGYVTFLQARGKGIYTYRPVEQIQVNDEMLSREGTRTLSLDMRYQDNIYEISDFAVAMLKKYSQKLTVPESVEINANRACTPLLACAFATLQVGDKIRLVVSSAGYEGEAFIQGMNFEIAAGDVVTYTLFLKEALYETDQIWILDDAVNSALGLTTVLGY